MSGWERLYAQPGGTVAAIAVVDNTHVFAATSAGIYQSSDDGFSWTPTSLHHGIPFCEVIAACAQTLFVGTHTGLHQSDDGGQSWRQVLAGGRVLSLALTQELLLVGTEEDGVLRSEDRGRTFAGANAGLVDRTVLALALSPAFARDGTGFAGTSSGLYRTRNGGKSWRAVDLDAAVQCLWLSPRFAEDQVVVAGTESDGMLRSDDAGEHWKPIADSQGRGVSALACSSKYTLAAATDAGIAISDDGGRSWRTTAVERGPVLALGFVSAGGHELLLAGLQHNGVARAVEPFTSWTASNAGLQARLALSVAFSPGFEHDTTIFMAGPDVGVMMSDDAGRTWTERGLLAEEAPVFGVAASPDLARDRSLFVATQAGLRASRDGGHTWETVGEPIPLRTVIAGPRQSEGRWCLLVVSMAGQLLALDDRGDTWRVLSDGFDAEVALAACAPDGTLFAATNRAGEMTLWRSADDGIHWQRYLVEQSESLSSVAVSPNYRVDQRVYVGMGSRVLTPIPHTREMRSGEQWPLWRSVDLGASIAALATPADAEHGHVVYAATSAGVRVSRDGADHFSGWPDATAPSATVAVALSPDYARENLVFALELGGALWCWRERAEFIDD